MTDDQGTVADTLATATYDPGPPDVHTAVAKVMDQVQSVGKTQRNTQQNFNFRGIDAVMNAVGPALRQHGVIVAPITVQQVEYVPVDTKGGARMTSVRLIVQYRWMGPRGDYFYAVAPGEAFDAGDKGTAKAMSVAFRTMLLQTLCLPTDEPDPDSSAYEQVSPERAKANTTVRNPNTAAASPLPVPDVPVQPLTDGPSQIGVEAFLSALRVARTLPDAERIQRVAALKGSAPPAVLEAKTDVAGKGMMTLGRLADAVATEAMVK